eukprot:gene8939-888_t
MGNVSHKLPEENKNQVFKKIPYEIDYERIQIHPLVVEKLYQDFLINFNQEEYVDKAHFRQKYQLNRMIEKYLFHAISSKEDKITFLDYLEYLNISSYGSKEEKSELICKMLDLNGKGKIQGRQLSEFVEGICLMNKEPKERKVEYLGICKNFYEKPKKQNETLKTNFQKIFKPKIPTKIEEEEKLKSKMEIIEEQNRILREKKEFKLKEQKRRSENFIKNILNKKKEEEIIFDDIDSDVETPKSIKSPIGRNSIGSESDQSPKINVSTVESDTINLDEPLKINTQIRKIQKNSTVDVDSPKIQFFDTSIFNDHKMNSSSNSKHPFDKISNEESMIEVLNEVSNQKQYLNDDDTSIKKDSLQQNSMNILKQQNLKDNLSVEIESNEFTDISIYQETDSLIPSDFNINESELNDLTINDFDEDELYDELDDPFIFEEITGTKDIEIIDKKQRNRSDSLQFRQDSELKKKKLLIDIKRIVKNEKSNSTAKERWEKVLDLKMKEKFGEWEKSKSEMKIKYETMKENFAKRMIEKQNRIEDFKKKIEFEKEKFDEKKEKIRERFEKNKEIFDEQLKGKFKEKFEFEKERIEIEKERIIDKIDKRKEEFLENVVTTFDVYNSSIIGFDDLKLKGIQNQTFLECFGLFPKFRNILKLFEDSKEEEISKFDSKNIKFLFGYPSIEGLLTSYSTNHKRFASVELTFISFYQGSNALENYKFRKPTRVLNLQECQITRRIDLDSLDKFVFEIEVSKPYYSRKLYLNDKKEIEKWIWVLRRNSGQVGFRFNSSFPVQLNNACNYFIGGKSYFEDLSNEMKNAKNEIFISGWVLSPHLYLNRNPSRDRFDDLLVEIAEKGVKIYILIWDENNWIIDLGTSYVKQHISQLHKNILIFKDPNGTVFQFWSHHQKCVIIDQEIGYCGGIDLAYNRWEDPEQYLIFDENEKYFPGMDYVNPLKKTVYVGDNLTSYLDRSKIPRMPWQDIQVKIVGIGGKDLAKNFIQRWNFGVRKFSSIPQLIMSIEPLRPKLREKENYQNCNIQIVRSACRWSFGTEQPERSIYDAYIELIEKSKHFIYIENQFFISAANENQKNPRNYIVAALIKRIKIAIEKKKNFKVIICVPFQTGFPMSESSTKIISYWQYKSIFRGENSLFGVLEKEYPKVDIGKYIFFCSLRTYGTSENSKNLTSQIIYIHSKMMLVDDRIAIIGSANINDRSLRGTRDSEICVVIEDEQKVESTMGGQKFFARKFAKDLRMKCWNYFFAHEKFKISMNDPILFFDTFVKTANNNTTIFNHVFQKIHSNVKNESDIHYLEEYNENLKPKNVELLKKLKGHLVTFPKCFLEESSKNSEIIVEIDKLFL